MPNIYDELPPCESWYDVRYGCYTEMSDIKFKIDEEFHFIFLFFDFSRSKNYKKALRIYNSIPERYRMELMAHSVLIFQYSDFLKIRKKFMRLFYLVRRWKSCQIWINNQLCNEWDLKVFLDIFDYRVIMYKQKNVLPKIEEE